MKISFKKCLLPSSAVIAVVAVVGILSGCNVARPAPKALWLTVEFPEAKYPFMQFTGVMRKIDKWGQADWRPEKEWEETYCIQNGYKKVYFYAATILLFSSTDGKEWKPVRFYGLVWQPGPNYLPLHRKEEYYTPEQYGFAISTFESWETLPLLDFGKKEKIMLKFLVRPIDKNIPEKYCVITLSHPKEKKQTRSESILFIDLAPRYPYKKIALPPWKEWKNSK